MKGAPVDIALAANHRYLPGLLATLASMALSASEKGRLRFHVFAEGLTDEDCRQVAELAERQGVSVPVEFQRPDMSRIRRLFKPYKGSHATYLRLFLCEFLTVDRVVYADVDTLWFRDVCELWDGEWGEASVCWCRDLPSIAQGVRLYSLEWNPRFDVERYACAGVVLMNLKRMRETRFVEKCVAFADRWGTPFFVDQDILNAVCFEDARMLPQVWDLMMPDRRAVEGAVIHFNGIGRMFNGPMEGWRPLHWRWYRFYYDVILGEKRRRVCGRVKSLVFWLLGSFDPGLVETLTKPLKGRMRDQIRRQLFFAWLWRRTK